MGISKGDRVSWKTSQGRTQGKAVERRTSPFEFDAQQFNAAADDPWIVKSEKTGAAAVHKESSLRSL